MDASELSRNLESFQSISRDLSQAYERLAERAEHVERELASANRALESKVRELDALHADLATLLSALPCGVVVREAGGRITSANPAALALLACTEGELPSALEEICDAARDTGRAEIPAQSGERRLLALREASVPAARADRAPREVVILEDLTDHDRLQRAVAQQDKMSALGTLSAGLAHEIRNPLNAVVGFASLLAARLDPESDERRWAEGILAGAEETNRIVTGLMDFARPGELCVQRFETEELLVEARDMATAPDGRAEPIVELRPELTELRGDRLKLRQALRNLVQNAIDNTPDPARVRVHAFERDGLHVLRVEDSGPGVDAAVRERLLEPFFTSRAEGTGLGLALTHAIAVLHGGALVVAPRRSDLGGAVFELSWPLG